VTSGGNPEAAAVEGGIPEGLGMVRNILLLLLLLVVWVLERGSLEDKHCWCLGGRWKGTSWLEGLACLSCKVP